MQQYCVCVCVGGGGGGGAKMSTILLGCLGICTLDCWLIYAQHILLTTRNNIAPKTLLYPVFNNRKPLMQQIQWCLNTPFNPAPGNIQVKI